MLGSLEIFPAGGLLEKLRAESFEIWEQYVSHKFVRGPWGWDTARGVFSILSRTRLPISDTFFSCLCPFCV